MPIKINSEILEDWDTGEVGGELVQRLKKHPNLLYMWGAENSVTRDTR